MCLTCNQTKTFPVTKVQLVSSLINPQATKGDVQRGFELIFSDIGFCSFRARLNSVYSPAQLSDLLLDGSDFKWVLYREVFAVIV